LAKNARTEHKLKFLGIADKYVRRIEKSKMIARGVFKGLELYIPMDAENQFSRVLSMSFGTQVTFK